MSLFERANESRERRHELRRRYMSRMLNREIPNPIERIQHFFGDTIWQDDPRAGFVKALLYPKLRVLTLVYWNYWAHGLSRHAAALTYSSLLALVPCLAVAFSLFAAFGGLKEGGDVFREKLFEYLSPSPEIRDQIAEKIGQAVAAVQHGVQKNALLGTLFLFVTVVNTLSWIESSFNDIFGIKRSRPIFARFTVYWAVATLGPVLIGASLAMTASVRSSAFVAYLQERVPVFELAYRGAPVVLTCAAFTLLYLFLPNAKVKFRAAAVGGMLGGLLFEGAKSGFTHLAVSLLANYSKVYGGIALLLVFFFWTWISWMILLIGCEFVVATQSATTHRREELAAEVSQKVRQMLALRVATEIAERFYLGAPPPTAEGLAAALDVPLRLAYDVLNVLEAHAIVREVENTSGEEHAFVPARHLAKLTIYDVVTAMREDGAQGLAMRADDEARYLARITGEAEAAIQRIFGEETLERVVENLFRWREANKKEREKEKQPEPEPAAAPSPAPPPRDGK